MKLIPFTESHYSTLVSWIPHAEFNLLWGGPTYQWPIDEQQISTQLKSEDVSPYLLLDEDKPIGYIDVVKVSDEEFRLCRILIANSTSRGKGYGTRLIEMAMEKTVLECGAKVFELGVYERNTQARHCYEKLGFQVYQQGESPSKLEGESWPILRMKCHL